MNTVTEHVDTDLTGHKIAIIGCGNMGLALMKGMIDSKAVPPENIIVKNKRIEKSEALAKEYGVRVAKTAVEAVESADVILLAVKPQIFSKVLHEIKHHVDKALLISVAAGISTGRIEAELGGTPRVIRTMPNTPALVKEGATAISAGENATDDDVNLAKTVFSKISRVVVVDEVHLDAVTGLSGSGPAYVFLIIEAFADAGVKVGLSREIAMELAVQTLKGSAAMLQQTKEHPGKLKDQVTSPGGTAIAGLHTLEEGGLRTTIMNAVEAATNRAKELGGS
ncbi:pyrroline-5-carboxylate reductase [Myxococcota bacterium]|nr:pyrroline-5-carboxylate reductase [Myxococcota bacterium]